MAGERRRRRLCFCRERGGGRGGGGFVVKEFKLSYHSGQKGYVGFMGV